MPVNSCERGPEPGVNPGLRSWHREPLIPQGAHSPTHNAPPQRTPCVGARARTEAPNAQWMKYRVLLRATAVSATRGDGRLVGSIQREVPCSGDTSTLGEEDEAPGDRTGNLPVYQPTPLCLPEPHSDPICARQAEWAPWQP
ncbi:unnamed protein product [Boreogadus saida]